MAEVIKEHCNKCGPYVNHNVVNKIEVRDGEVIDNRYELSWADIYTVLQCAGCDSVKILHEDWFSEHYEPDGNLTINKRYYPPAIFRKEPEWLNKLSADWHITRLLREVYSALQNNAPSLAAMGIRAVLEAIMIDKVNDQGTFINNLKAFQDKGFISQIQLDRINDALELGHASIHRGFIPQSDQVIFALELTEAIVHHLYVLEDEAKEAVKGIPPKKP